MQQQPGDGTSGEKTKSYRIESYIYTQAEDSHTQCSNNQETEHLERKQSLLGKTEVPRDVRKLKSPETRQVQKRLVSTLEHLQDPKWDRTMCPEE